MRHLLGLTIISLLIPTLVFAHPIQWVAELGGNGHWYQLIYSDTPITWEDASINAESIGGHLATLTTQSENEWVYQSVVVPNHPSYVTGILLGGFLNTEPGGGWEWITGEPWDYEAWRDGEPNGGGERGLYLEYASFSIMGWNDTGNEVDHSYFYLVEHENGITDHSLQFDGQNDLVEIPSAPSLQISEEMTISAWIKVDSENIGHNFVEKGDWDNGWGYSLSMQEDNRLLFSVIDVSGGFDCVDVRSNTILESSTWHHVAAVFDAASECILYVNGDIDSLTTDFNPACSLVPNSAPLRIGARPGWGRFYKGNIDQVSYWTRALPQSEIINLMCSGVSGDEANLGGFWSFNEALGSEVYDSSPNGNVGAIIGATWDEDSPQLIHPIRICDSPDDQGGFLQMSWHALPNDAVGLADSIATYFPQRFEGDVWTTLATIPAAQADSYQVELSTSDIYTIGQPEPFARYRILAQSSDLAAVYYSMVDSAYSIDNLPPPKPVATVADDLSNRFVVCIDPSVPDLGDVCFYRGIEPGFSPGDPIQCSDQFVFTEDHLIYYVYRVQYSDIHGNLSEFSDELIGQYPTGIGEAPSPVFSLRQNHPNPFNPSTTIQFCIPEAVQISLLVYDVSGKLVRSLIVRQVMEQGNHQRQWDGLDDGGRQVSAGVYFCRMTAGEFIDVKRMALVK